MAQRFNVIEAEFSSRNLKCVIGPLWQYDYGQILKITGITLPDTYEVHFSNDPRGTAKRIPGNSSGVKIPDEYLMSGSNVFAWLYVHQGLYDGSTEYQIEIQVRRRAKPVDYQPGDENEEKLIEQLIENKVNAAVRDMSAEFQKKIIENLSVYFEQATANALENRIGTDEEVKKMLDEVFGPNRGDIATDEEVGDVIEDVFGDDTTGDDTTGDDTTGDDTTGDDTTDDENINGEIATDEEVNDMFEDIFGKN